MQDIKIFVTCNNFIPNIPDNNLFNVIQAGAALAQERFSGVSYDDLGDNISDQNREWCELTSQYYAWKNVKADYYGFFHYRRFLCFANDKYLKEDGWGNVVCDELGDRELDLFKLDEQSMRTLIENYDVIVPRKRNLRKCIDREQRTNTVYSQYVQSENHHEKDLLHLIDAIKNIQPDYLEDAIEYLNGYEAYECNMFVMNNYYFHDYSSWLFSILFETKKHIEDDTYNAQENRAIAFLGERALGIYIHHLIKMKKAKICELQKVFIKAPKQRELSIKPLFDSEVPIVMASNKSFAPYMSVFIQSIIENRAEDTYLDILIFHDDISKNYQKIIYSIAGEDEKVSIRFIDVGTAFDFSNLYTSDHITKETYYRFASVKLLTEYSKVLYLDGDMICLSDLRELYEIDMGNALVAAVRDVDFSGNCRRDRITRDYANDVLMINKYSEYFQAGVLVLNLERIRTKLTFEKLVSIASSRNWMFWDQDVLNYAFKGEVFYLPQIWNVLMNWSEKKHTRMERIIQTDYVLYKEYMNARENPKIIHYAGGQKPWIYPTCDYSTYFWKYARCNPFYEEILHGSIKKWIPKELVNSENETIETHLHMDKDDENHDMAIALIKKLNKVFPPGSKKRDIARNLGKKWLGLNK